MSKVQLPKAAQQGLRRAIKAGVRGEFPTSTEGTPQGGVISPLLANIALNGIEDGHRMPDWITCLRYADDLVFIFKTHPGEGAKGQILGRIEKFLEVRGLRIKASKTRIVRATEGFDFLGWNFKVKPNGKFISTPAKDSTKRVKAKVKETMKDSRFTLEDRIAKCGSLIRGWRNYNQFCDMSKDDLWAQHLWTWKYIRKQGRYDRQGTTRVIGKAFPSVPWKACSHNNVTGDKSVFDGDLFYWAKRGNKNYSGVSASLLKQQKHKCQACGLSFFSDDKVELHHIDGNHANWSKSNLEMLHRHCHQHKPIHGEARVARNLNRNAVKSALR